MAPICSKQSIIYSGPDFITGLPTELLAQILDLCRPFDFEHAVLACKTFYEAARHLSKVHNECKRRLQDPDLQTTPSGHIVIQDPFEFWEWLLKLKPEDQEEQLRYIRRAVIDPLSMMAQTKDCRPIARRMFEECPQLGESIAQVVQNLSDAADTWTTDPLYVHLRDPAPSPLPYPAFLPGSCTMNRILLCTLNSLESVIVPSDFFSNREGRLPKLVSQWKNMFKNLRELHIEMKFEPLSCTQLLQVLQMPIHTLILDNLEQPNSLLSGDMAEGGDCVSTSLERLVLLRADFVPFDLTYLLRCAPRLTTLVWEDDPYTGGTCCISDEHDDVDSFWSDPRQEEKQITRRQRAAQSPQILGNASGVLGGLPVGLPFGPPPGWFPGQLIPPPPTEQEEQPPWGTHHIKPSRVMARLTKSHGHILERLVFIVNPWRSIPDDFKIKDFLAFKKLTDLEISLRFLHPQCFDEVKTTAPSMVFPTGICMLSIILECGMETNSEAAVSKDGLTLLERLLAAKNDLPALQQVVVTLRWRRYEKLGRSVRKAMREYTRRFEEIGITFEWQRINVFDRYRTRMHWESTSSLWDTYISRGRDETFLSLPSPPLPLESDDEEEVSNGSAITQATNMDQPHGSHQELAE